VGQRMEIKYTRALVNAALDGTLSQVGHEQDSVFGVQVPTSCPGVPKEILKPRNTWKDKKAYDTKADHLARLFVDNFREYENQAPPEVKMAGPRPGVSE